jgi:hypothetical protein
MTGGIMQPGSEQGANAPGEERRLEQVLALASSAVLHGTVLVLLLTIPLGVRDSHGAIELVPIEVEVAKQTHGEATDLVHAALPTQPAPQASSAGPTQAADALQAKLEALAMLRQPDIGLIAPAQSAPDSELATTRNDAVPGQLTAFRDYIRDQVERHWSLNLSALGSEDFSIPIRIDIARDGTVLKAELVGTARSADPVYGEIAASARNAVLSASPLTLPAGDYPGVMRLVLSLDPRDTLR